MDQESKTILQAMQEAREQAEKNRDRFKLKSTTRYGDIPIEAYARLARARNRSQVGSAAGYAQRQICRLKQCLRTDPERASEIKAAIQQLQKAQSRSAKKVRDLDRESNMARMQKKKEAEQQRQAMRIKHELQRRRAVRSVREGAYIHEAAISGYMQVKMAEARAEFQLPGAGDVGTPSPVSPTATMPSAPVSGGEAGISIVI